MVYHKILNLVPCAIWQDVFVINSIYNSLHPFKIQRLTKAYIFLIPYYYILCIFLFSCFIKETLISPSLEFLKCHIFSFTFHICVTRQQECALEISMPQKGIYNQKISRAQVVHDFLQLAYLMQQHSNPAELCCQPLGTHCVEFDLHGSALTIKSVSLGSTQRKQ